MVVLQSIVKQEGDCCNLHPRLAQVHSDACYECLCLFSICPTCLEPDLARANTRDGIYSRQMYGPNQDATARQATAELY